MTNKKITSNKKKTNPIGYRTSLMLRMLRQEQGVRA